MKTMKLYNTLSRQVEEITPLSPPAVTIYTCGPTVYDYPHIGNWFTFVRYELLVRALKLQDYETKWAMNITDVGHLVSDADDGEDKLEKGARREGKTAWDVAKFYGDYFISGMERLAFTQPDYLPKATEHIDEQIALIKALEAKGYTYTIDDGVYYDTSKFPQYADFARLDLEEQQAGKRVEFNPQKRNATDFALWKFTPTGQKRDMEWPSPWGKGFPGWHLECSAMSMKYLGETIDVHCGGIDHIPVHHTNEIAQSEAVTGKKFSNYWMHANHILVEDKKISKSLGNGITLEDIETRGFNLAALRLHILESHYRSQSKFSWEGLEAASNRLQRWRELSDLRWQARQTSLGNSQDVMGEVETALCNDLDTPAVLFAIDQFMNVVEQSGVDSNIEPGFTRILQFIKDGLGLDLFAGDITDEQKSIIASRENARANKDWAKSDELRDSLQAQGLGLRDTASGAVWYRLKSK